MFENERINLYLERRKQIITEIKAYKTKLVLASVEHRG